MANWVDKNLEGLDWYGDCRTALGVLAESGTNSGARNAKMAILWIPQDAMRGWEFEPVAVRLRGGSISGDCVTPTEVPFRCLTSHSIDYGGKVRIDDANRRLRTSEESEANRRANLHLSDDAEWRCSCKSARVPSNRRVGFLENGLRVFETQPS